MPAITYTPLADDDDLTAASLETPSGNVESGINGIMQYGTRRGSVGAPHVDTIVDESGWTDNAASPRTTLTISGEGTHDYTAAYNGFGNETGPTLIGGAPVTGTYDSDDALLFNHSSGVLLGMDRGNKLAGILVLLNVEWRSIASNVVSQSERVMVAIQIYVNGAWYQIKRTERLLDWLDRMDASISWPAPDATADGVVRWDIPLRTFITAADIDAEPGLDADVHTVEKIQAVVAIDKTNAPTITLGRCQFTIVPIHAEAL